MQFTPPPVLISADPATTSWIKELLLEEDKKILLSTEQWLSDRIISAGLELIRRESGNSILGLQSPVIGQGDGVFKTVGTHQKFIQILNMSNCHWVLVTNIDIQRNKVSENVVRVYDSYKSKVVTSRALYDICCLMRPRGKSITIDFMNTTMQPNPNDCGLFALANAFAVAKNIEPVLCEWDIKEMRKHLLKCFETRQLVVFPYQQRRISFAKKMIRSKCEKVYCLCRLPAMPKGENIPMVQCFTNGFMKVVLE